MIALPAWLITNSLAVAGLYPIAWLLSRLCRTRPAVAHLVWLLLIVKLIAPPLVYWPWSLDRLAVVFAPAKTVSQPVAANETVAASADMESMQPRLLGEPKILIEQSSSSSPLARLDPQPLAEARWNLAPLIFPVWSLGATVIALGGLRALWLQRRALRACQPAPDYLVQRIKELAAQIGIRPPAALIRSRLSTPVLCCAGRPRLLWPSEMSDPQTVARSDGVLAHELAHIKRHDHWTVYLELLAAIVCWWNPLFWLIRRQLHQTRELACDALALAVARQPRADYAKELLSISTSPRQAIVLAPAFGAGLASRHFLKRRLTMVFDDRVSPRTPAAGIALLLALAAVALPAVTLAQQAAVSSAPTDIPAFVEEEPVAQSDSTATIPAPAFPTNDVPASATQNAAQSPTPVKVSEDARVPAIQNEGLPLNSSFTVTTPVTEATLRKLGRFAESRTFQAVLPNGGGTLRLRKNDDGSIDVELEQAGVRLVQSQVERRSNTAPAPNTATSSPTYPWTGLNTTAAASSPATALQPTLSSALPQTYATAANTSLSARDSLDKEMLKSDVDLAKINLEEKMVQVDIARKDGKDQDRIHLAELAVRRAQIELDRAELQLKKGISASRR